MPRTVQTTTAIVVAALATACGSTVQEGGTVSGPGAFRGLTPASPTSSAVTPLGTAPRLSVPGTAQEPHEGPAAPGARASTSQPTGTPGVAGVPGADALGVTPTTITIGVPYDPEAAAGAASLGATSPVPDVKRYVEIVVADLNAHGGMAGRRLKADFFADRSSGGTSAQRAATVCEHYTKDTRVLAVLPVTPELAQCLNRAGVLSAAGNITGLDDAAYRALPTYFDLTALATDQIVENLVTALQAQSYFTGWDVRLGRPGTAPMRVGILAPDSGPWVKVVPRVLIPALERIGVQVKPENVFIWHFPDGASGNAEAVSQMSSAVLRFSQNGVTHFIPVENNSAMFFGAAAEQQQYRPRYALSSSLAVPQFAGNVLPYNQLNGAVGLSWSPSVDLREAQANSKTYAGPAAAACTEAFRRAGVTFASPLQRAVAMVACDGVKLLKAAVEAVPVGRPITTASAIAGLESLGSRFPAAGLPVTRFGPDRHYPAALGWHVSWDSSCRCQVFNGKGYALR